MSSFPLDPMPRKVKVAALQLSFSGEETRRILGSGASIAHSENSNVDKVVDYVEKAAAQGAQIILPPELFQYEYFCREERAEYFALAESADESPLLRRFQELARRLEVVIPVSFFEKEGPCYYNSLAMMDADGTQMGIYRKSHIPDGPGYEEKFYFRPGNTGFKVWKTRYASVGVGICWDQWFPECARALMLGGAEILMYPTAIGSEPEEPNLNTKDPWQRAMIGHAVSNLVPIVAANRIGVEGGEKLPLYPPSKPQTFYGHSFICDHRGVKVAELGSQEEEIIVAEFNLTTIEKDRAAFGFFRDRRPELY